MPAIPEPPESGEPQRINGVMEIAAGYDLIILDAYGVLHEGDEAFPWAVEALEALRDARRRICVVTNDVTHDPAEVAARLTARRLPVEAGEVVSGRSLLPDVLRAHGDGAGYAVLGTHPEAVIAQFPKARAGSFAMDDLDDAKGFILVDTNSWTTQEPEWALMNSLRRHPRPLVVCNPDVTCPFQGKLSYEPGYFAFRLLAGQPEVQVCFLGKPYPAIYDLVCRRFPGIARSRMLAVGDSPHTDVLGARGAGMKALLVESGLLKGQPCPLPILPDYIAPTL